MRFDVSSTLSYQISSPTVFIFDIHALRTRSQSVLAETLTLEPHVAFEEYASASGESRFVRLEQGPMPSFVVSYRATVETKPVVLERETIERVKVQKLQELHHDIIPFVFPSRYCESDMLSRLAYRHFGGCPTDYDRVVAITTWVFENVEYVSGSTNANTSAYDTVTQGAGVCRDFAHLSIALCRALNIPARYFTAYAYRLDPPDFHACFEAYVGGRWMLFDSTRLAPLNGLVRIGSGRDAADSSVATIFGNTILVNQTVSCTLVGDESAFVPLTHDDLEAKGISYDIGPEGAG